MALLHVSYFSVVLQMQVGMDVILPQHAPWKSAVAPPYQTLYLLHGIGEDHSAWQRNTALERYAEKYNLAVIMPSSARGFYTDIQDGHMWWTHISEELPKICGDMFRLSERREDTFAVGASMGAYGAMKLALRNPDRFCAAAGISGAYLGREFSEFMPEGAYSNERRAEMLRIFGEEFRQGDDIFDNLRHAACLKDKPLLYLCCGKKDSLFEVSAAFREAALKSGFDVTWSEDANAEHTWSYWDSMLPLILRWLPLRKAMKL